MSIYDVAMKYQSEGTPLVVFAGQEYGTGSSRDWAAKGTKLLGVKAVVVQSFERIHRSNLVGMGVLPLQFKEGTNAQTLKLDGSELYDVLGLNANLKPQQDLTLRITRADGRSENVPVICRIDTPIEIDYYQHGTNPGSAGVSPASGELAPAFRNSLSMNRKPRKMLPNATQALQGRNKSIPHLTFVGTLFVALCQGLWAFFWAFYIPGRCPGV